MADFKNSFYFFKIISYVDKYIVLIAGVEVKSLRAVIDP